MDDTSGVETSLSPDSFAERYNPFQSPQLEDPYPVYARARREAPVFYSPVLTMWVVSRHDDIMAVLRDPGVFSSADMLKNSYEHVPEAIRVLEEGGYARMPLTVDNTPPSHTRVRGAVSRGFVPRRTATIEPVVRAVAEELIDGFARDGEVDLMERFAIPLALQTIMRFIGVPLEDMSTLKAWADDWGAFLWAPLSSEDQVKCAHSMVAYLRYGMSFVEDRKRSPKEDLMSDLIRAQKEGGGAALSDAEMAYMVNDLIFAGHETTAGGIGNAVKALLGHPEELERIRRQPELLPAAVDELLRVDAPSQSLMRTATREAVIGGVTLPEGARVCLLIGSANRDEAVFSDPERVDLARKNVERTVSFGQGIHACIGLSLAKLEIRVALDLLIRRLPGLRLSPDQAFVYKPNLIFRGLARLNVRWDKSATAAS